MGFFIKTVFFMLLVVSASWLLMVVVEGYYNQTVGHQGLAVDAANSSEVKQRSNEKQMSAGETFTSLASAADVISFPEYQPTTIEGFDWSLPAYAKPAVYSGFISMKPEPTPLIKHSFVILRWDEANPQPGVFDYFAFEKQLEKLKPRGVLVRLEVNSACEAPQWVLDKVPASKDKSLIFWDKAYLDHLSPFIRDFARRYAGSKQIIGVQLGIGDGEFSGPCDDYDNKQGWGEFWMSPETLQEAIDNFALTPELFEQRSKHIIDLYANTFGKHKYKLAFTNQGPLYSWGEQADPYNQRLNSIAQYAMQIGIGARDGEIEKWMRYLDKIYGTTFVSKADGTCALGFDEDYAKQVAGRYWGTENEFYGNKKYVLDRHGPLQNQPYRFLLSSLRALQLRRNFISLSDDAMVDTTHPVYKTQEFMQYLSKTLGKSLEDTPDTFILLGERYINAFRAKRQADAECVKTRLDSSNDKIPVRSFGRWLNEESNSQPDLKITMPASENYWDQKYYLPDNIDYEYFARRGQQFRFDLKDELVKKRCKQACDVEIKVVYKDTASTEMAILARLGEDQVRTKSLQTNSDYQIKTATFKLKADFKNNMQDHDFILESTIKSLPIIMLRVNLLEK